MKFGIGLFVCGCLASLGATAAHFDTRYATRIGDLNGDGRTDVYLQYQPKVVPVSLDDLLVPIPTTRREVGEFVLQQNASGGFQAVALSSAQKSQVLQWPKSTMSTIVGDLNGDLQWDLYLQGASAAIPGAHDAFVFAPHAQQGMPIGVKARDDSMARFVTDINGASQSPSHFDSGWVLVRQYDEVVVLPVYRCGQQYYPDASILNPDPEDDVGGAPGGEPLPGLPNGGVGCSYVFDDAFIITRRDWRFDPSGFSLPAFNIYRAVGYYFNLQGPTIPADRAEFVRAQLESLFGVAFDRYPQQDIVIDEPKVQRAPPWAWIRLILRVVTKPAIVVGGIIWPEDTADDDTWIPYLHYGYAEDRLLFEPGMRKPSWVTTMIFTSGSTAQQQLALPIHRPGDAPPDSLYQVIVFGSTPIIGPTVVQPQTFARFGMTVSRSGGGIEWKLPLGTGAGTVAGPFPLPSEFP